MHCSGNYDGYAAGPRGPPTYGSPPPPAGAQPGQLGFNVPLQVGYGGHTANFSVPVNAAQLGPGGQYVSQQVQQPGGGAGGGFLPKGKWADGLFDCANSPIIFIVVCFCPCVRFGLTVNRAMPVRQPAHAPLQSVRQAELGLLLTVCLCLSAVSRARASCVPA